MSPSRLDPINHQGFSDNEINYDLESEDEFHLDDELDNIDPRSISQSTNILLGKAKGGEVGKAIAIREKTRPKRKGLLVYWIS